MVLMGYSEARGTLIYEKNRKSKISCQTPFKIPFLGGALIGGTSPPAVKVVWFGYITHLTSREAGATFHFLLLILPVDVPAWGGGGGSNLKAEKVTDLSKKLMESKYII
jgi:hypothetical protein